MSEGLIKIKEKLKRSVAVWFDAAEIQFLSKKG